MNKKEELELKFKILHEALNSDNPSKAFKKYEEKYPEILDKTLVRLNKEKEADNSKKRKLNKIQDEVNLDIIDMNDDCTYYKFQFGIIGKYDPDKSNYYIYEDNTWKISGNVMRWVEDAGYDVEVIDKKLGLINNDTDEKNDNRITTNIVDFLDNIVVPFRGWTVIREIGYGGFGKVYEIRRDQYGIDERSAMKVIAVPLDPNEINTYLRDGYSPETLRKMYEGNLASVQGEYQTMARLRDCPNIVQCDDIEIVMDPDGIGSKIYIRMELLTPIRDYEKLQSFNEEEVIKLGSDICNILVRCEKESIVHCDIKPENIMVSNRGDYKLGDFGIARLMDPTRIGALLYMAPEFYLGKKLGHKADIYSLGLVLYWLLNNRRMPFFPQDDSEIKSNSSYMAQKMRMAGTPVPRPLNGSPELSRVVLKALSYDPSERYQTALEFGNAIRSCLSKEPDDALKRAFDYYKKLAEQEDALAQYIRPLRK